jgi:hypothetical protein
VAKAQKGLLIAARPFREIAVDIAKLPESVGDQGTDREIGTAPTHRHAGALFHFAAAVPCANRSLFRCIRFSIASGRAHDAYSSLCSCATFRCCL